MKAHRRIAAATAAAMLGFVPAVAFASAGGNSANHANPAVYSEHGGSPKAKKYGHLCSAQGASRKHVAGQKGTPFSDCVKAMAQMAKHSSESAKKACSAESKKHVAGSPGTPFSECVKAGAQLRKSEHHSSTTSSSGS